MIEDSGGPMLPNEREQKQLERLLNGDGGNGSTLLIVGGAAAATLIIVLFGGLLFRSRVAKKRASTP